MLTAEELSNYLEGSLSPEEAEAFEERLLGDEAGLREVIRQEQTEAALRVMILGSEHVRASILAETGAHRPAESRLRVMREVSRSAIERRKMRIRLSIGIAAGLAAAACLAVVIRFARGPVADEPQANLVREEHPVVLPAPEFSPQPSVTPVTAVNEPVNPPHPSTLLASVPTPPSPPETVTPLVPSTSAAPPVVAMASLPPAPASASASASASPRPVPSPMVKPSVPASVPPRDDLRFLEPFAADSPWKQRVPAGARLTALRWPDRKDAPKLAFRWRDVGVAGDLKEGGPKRRWQDPVTGIEAFMPMSVPNLARLPEVEMAVAGLAKGQVLELTGSRLSGVGSFEPGQVARVDLSGDGFSGGLTASGASYLGGVIRERESAGPIRHALALVLNPKLVRYSGDGFVAPATRAPAEGRKFLSDRGNVLLGSRLVLPPDFDVTRTGTAKPVAEALRDYGAYVVDVDAGAFFQICINGVLPDGWVSQLQPLVEELRVVVPK